jgi:hypothetical protein
LVHQGDGSLIAVVVCDGERNPLALLSNSQDDELPGLRFGSHIGVLDYDQLGDGGQDLFSPESRSPAILQSVFGLHRGSIGLSKAIAHQFYYSAVVLACPISRKIATSTPLTNLGEA